MATEWIVVGAGLALAGRPAGPVRRIRISEPGEHEFTCLAGRSMATSSNACQRQMLLGTLVVDRAAVAS